MLLEMVHTAAMATVTEIMDDVLALSRTDRSYLATKLIESLDAESELSPEWMEEIERRVKSIDDGTARRIPHNEVMAEARRIIQS
jgi:putative addiction module component (TIGR02574 family)